MNENQKKNYTPYLKQQSNMEKNLVLTEIKDVDLSKLEFDKVYKCTLFDNQEVKLMFKGDYFSNIYCSYYFDEITHIYLPPSSNSLQEMREADGWIDPKNNFWSKEFVDSEKIKDLQLKPVYFAPFLSQPIEEDSNLKNVLREVDKMEREIASKVGYNYEGSKIQLLIEKHIE